jgi:hypothetical protein
LTIAKCLLELQLTQQSPSSPIDLFPQQFASQPKFQLPSLLTKATLLLDHAFPLQA